MSGGFIGNTIAAAGGTFYMHLDISWEDRPYHNNLRVLWFDYTGRSPVGLTNQNPYFELWPRSSFLDNTNQMGTYAGNNNTGGPGEAFWNIEWGDGGSYRPYFVSGQVVASDGVTPVSGVTVELFLTSTNAIVSTSVTNGAGYYQLPTPYNGQNHYVNAYLAGSPDTAGTTINTLQPS